MYIPHQRDIAFVDLDPSRGYEIKKRRPAVVISNYEFNRRTGFCFVCAVSTTKRKQPIYVDLKTVHSKVTGQVSSHQMRSLDYNNRKIEKVDVCDIGCFAKILETIDAILSIEE